MTIVAFTAAHDVDMLMIKVCLCLTFFYNKEIHTGMHTTAGLVLDQ